MYPAERHAIPASSRTASPAPPAVKRLHAALHIAAALVNRDRTGERKKARSRFVADGLAEQRDLFGPVFGQHFNLPTQHK
jgi:hypothetical protein